MWGKNASCGASVRNLYDPIVWIPWTVTSSRANVVQSINRRQLLCEIVPDECHIRVTKRIPSDWVKVGSLNLDLRCTRRLGTCSYWRRCDWLEDNYVLMIKLNVGLSVTGCFLQNTETDQSISSDWVWQFDTREVNLNSWTYRNRLLKAINHNKRNCLFASDVEFVVRPKRIDISVQVTPDPKPCKSNDNTGKFLVDFVRIKAQSRMPSIHSWNRVRHELEQQSLLKRCHQRCDKFKMQGSKLINFIWSGLCSHGSSQINSISEPIRVQHFRRNRGWVIEEELHIKLVPFDHRIDRQSQMILINSTFCCYGNWNLRILELVIRWGYNCDNCLCWISIVVNAFCSLFRCLEETFYLTVDVRVWGWDWWCHLDYHWPVLDVLGFWKFVVHKQSKL